VARPRRIQSDVAFDTAASLGEGPVWDSATQTLLWVDIDAGELRRFDPASGADESVVVPGGVTACGLRDGGSFVLATVNGFALASWTGGRLELEIVGEPERENKRVRMNDGKCDPFGRFWAGSMSYSETEPLGSLYVLGSDRHIVPVASGLTISNGLGWSPSGDTMYHIDSATYSVAAVDFDPAAGSLCERRILWEVSSANGMPDGMAVDAEGGLWIAFWNGHAVRRYAPSGELLAEVEVLAGQVTSCCFGGSQLEELYITTAAQGLSSVEVAKTLAGRVFVADPGVAGLQVARFAG
jgi:sugar lactone lactonase YvrE